MSSSQTCNWHAEWRAAYVVEAAAEAEVNRSWIATLLTANTNLKVGTGCTATVNRELDELANTVLVDGLEWVSSKQSVVEVVVHESADIVAAETKGHLGKVVGSE